MSAAAPAARPAATVAVAGGVPFGRALAAELVRTRHSASARFPVAGLVIALLQGAGWWFVATRDVTGWAQLFGWQSIYATGLLAPLVALLAGFTVGREKAAREGGTLWRPLAPAVGWLARATVLAGQSLAFNAALVLPVLGLGVAKGLTGAPVARLVALTVVCWLTSLPVAAWALLVARRAGMIVTVALALAWQVAGVLRAEGPTWAVEPWTWPVRAMMPLLGIHPNAMALDPGSPVWAWDPWSPALGCVGLAVALGLLDALTAGRLRDRRPRRILFGRDARDTPDARGAAADAGASPALLTPDDAVAAADVALHSVRRGRPAPLVGLAASLLRTAIAPLLLAALVAIPAVGVLWNAAYVRGFSGWLVVPLGSCLLACLLWAAQQDAWRVLALRHAPAALAGRLLALGALAVTAVAGEAALVAGLRGDPDAVRFGVVLAAVGLAWLVLCLALVTRVGAGAEIGVTILALVFSLVFGGTWLSRTPVWLVGVLGWPASADDLRRAALAVGLCALLALAGGLAWVRGLRAAASR